MAPGMVDIEKGFISSSIQSGIEQLPTTDANTLNRNQDAYPKLQLFQILVGIRTPQTIVHDSDAVRKAAALSSWFLFSPKPSQNVGLYQRTEDEYRSNRTKYIIASTATNTLYMLQILLAATFTAMSAYKDSTPITLTILGALNTVLAGALAWNKGQGIPQRFRKAMDQYSALLLSIETTERAFLDTAHPLDPHSEHTRLQRLFEIARADQQANYPDLYVSTGTAAAGDAKVLAKALDDVKADAQRVQTDMAARVEELIAALQGRLGTDIEARLDKIVKV